MLSFLLHLSLLAPGEPIADPPAVAAPPAPRGRFAALALRVDGPGLEDLSAALRLRLPQTAIGPELPPGCEGSPCPEAPEHAFAYVRSGLPTSTRHAIGVITSDGRAFFREVDTGADPPARVLASVLANLIRSIEQGAVAPDRTDVPLPARGEAPLLPGEEPPTQEVPVPEPPAEATPEEAVPEDIPTREVPKGPASVPADRSPPPPRPRWEISLAPRLDVGLSLGPPRFGVILAAAGGGVALDVRSPGGGLVGGEVRVLGGLRNGHVLARVRLAVMGGYALRRGPFELITALGVSIEPWWVTPAADLAEVRGAMRPLFGGHLRVAPGLHVPLSRGPLRGLRVGPRLELAGSFLVDDGARVAGVSLAGDSRTRLFRLGGLELHAGLELALWFGRAR